MIRVIRQLLYRMIKDKGFMLTALFLTPIVIIGGIFLSKSSVYKEKIGVIGDINMEFNDSKYIIYQVNEMPAKSELILGKYDAILYKGETGIEIETIKGEDYEKNLLSYLNGEKRDYKGSTEGTISCVIGTLLFYLFLLAVKLHKFYFQDQQAIAKRILITNISKNQYILSNYISIFLIIDLPTSIYMVIIKNILNINTSITNLQLILITLLISLLAASFGLLISTLSADLQSANMKGTMIASIMTLISGTLFQDSNNWIINNISKFMPQREMINYINSMEYSNIIINNNMFYVIIITLLTLMIALIINNYKTVYN